MVWTHPVIGWDEGLVAHELPRVAAKFLVARVRHQATNVGVVLWYWKRTWRSVRGEGTRQGMTQVKRSNGEGTYGWADAGTTTTTTASTHDVEGLELERDLRIWRREGKGGKAVGN